MAAVAHAAEPVVIAIDACLEDDAAAIVELAALESRRAFTRSIPPAGAADVGVHCGERGTVEIVATSKAASAATRTVQLGSVDPRVRARVIALALAEALETRAARPALQTQALLPLPVTPPSRPWFVAAEGAGRLFTRSQSTVGGGLGLWWDAGPSHALWAGAAFESGAAARNEGTVQLRSVSLLVGGSIGHRAGAFGIAGGPGLAGGFVSARGQPALPSLAPGTVTGPWAGAVLRGEFYVLIGRSMRFSLPIETGTTFVSIRGNSGTDDQNLWRGPWVRATLSLGWRL